MDTQLPQPSRRRSDAPDPGWTHAWAELARAAGLHAGEPLVLALSGGADSCFLLQLLCEAEPRPPLRVVHVAHGLRGAESEADAEFCAARCAALGLDFQHVAAALDPAASGLEQRARRARYRALAAAARAYGASVILTGHHADDALETLLMRLLRGTDPAGWAGPRLSNELGPDLDPDCARDGNRPLRVVRPLLGMRREEVRELLRRRGLAWRDDTSNLDRRFTRNRVRLDLVPLIEGLGGRAELSDLRAFALSIERFEDELARCTAHLAWQPLPHARAARPLLSRRCGGRIARSALATLPPPLLRRALWRLLRQGSGHAPSRDQLAALADALRRGRCARFNLRGAWHAWLRADELQLLPPRAALGPLEPPAGSTAAQPGLPFPGPRGRTFTPEPEWPLSVPGSLALPDGRVLRATWVERNDDVADIDGAAAPAAPAQDSAVELDAEGLPEPLCVRWPRRGDRFHGLGAPGHKSLARFLSGLGIAREDRAGIPIVCAAGEIVWVAGVRPCERHKLRRSTRRRLHLELGSSDPGSA
jgi:tRNA(Ile)-lysidine synthase